MTTDPAHEHELERETRRLTARYLEEVVVELELCPWAQPALQRGSVQISVITDVFERSALASAARVCAQRLLAVATEIELVLLVLPRLDAQRLDMDEVLRLLRDQMAQVEGVATFALAAFHPEAEPETSSGERFIPFLRRSPDPLVQAVRFTSLARLEDKQTYGTTFLDPQVLVRSTFADGPAESLRARIARRNLNRVLERGLDEVKARLDDICEDRRTTHRRLGLER